MPTVNACETAKPRSHHCLKQEPRYQHRLCLKECHFDAWYAVYLVCAGVLLDARRSVDWTNAAVVIKLVGLRLAAVPQYPPEPPTTTAPPEPPTGPNHCRLTCSLMIDLAPSKAMVIAVCSIQRCTLQKFVASVGSRWIANECCWAWRKQQQYWAVHIKPGDRLCS